MWLPLEHRHRPQLKLFGPRFEAERGSEWYLQSGAAATMKSMALGVLLREHLRSELGHLPTITSSAGDRSTALIVFEAYVVGPFNSRWYPLRRRCACRYPCLGSCLPRILATFHNAVALATLGRQPIWS